MTSVVGLPYTYDDNGNMTYRGSDNQTITWDVENQPVMVSENGTVVATFIYDGDGNRVKKTEAGETVLYINKYYEKNLTTGNVTTSYYLGSRLIAQREGEEVRFIHQDHLSGTSLVTSDNGTLISSIKYFPYGDTRSGDVPTDVKFTGQRLDSGTGLYYYNARYYDPLIGRFISADTFVPWLTGTDIISYSLTVNAIPVSLGSMNAPQGNCPSLTTKAPKNPQSLNRYSYVLNNPLKYTDPYGWWTFGFGFNINCGLFGGVSIQIMVVFDNHGGIGVAGSASGGLEVGATLSATGQVQYTTADTILDLQGNSMTTGGSFGVGLVGGFEQVNAVGNSVPGQLDYVGWNGNLGIGIGTPVEVHSYYDITGVEVLREPSQQKSDSSLPINSTTSNSESNKQSDAAYTSALVEYYLSLFGYNY